MSDILLGAIPFYVLGAVQTHLLLHEWIKRDRPSKWKWALVLIAWPFVAAWSAGELAAGRTP